MISFPCPCLEDKRRSRRTARLFLNLSTSFTPRPLYPKDINTLPIGKDAEWARSLSWLLLLSGFETRTSQFVSQSLNLQNRTEMFSVRLKCLVLSYCSIVVNCATRYKRCNNTTGPLVQCHCGTVALPAHAQTSVCQYIPVAVSTSQRLSVHPRGCTILYYLSQSVRHIHHELRMLAEEASYQTPRG